MEVMRLDPGCISCIVKKQLMRYPESAERTEVVKYMQSLLKIVSDAPATASAPEIVDEIYKLQYEMFGMKNDYSDVKSYFNSIMLEEEPKLQEKVKNSPDPLKQAVSYVMAGNYIDFGAMDKVDEERLTELLESTSVSGGNEKELANMREDIEKAKKIVYLTDNCGEIVLDKLLINAIRDINPMAEITAIVRGGNVLNDATMEDAEQVGLTSIVRVIGNGSSVAGTCLGRISEDALKVIDDADVIISKGQGNFETLNRCGKNIYYIFMCKCSMFADRFDVPICSGMLINDARVRSILGE